MAIRLKRSPSNEERRADYVQRRDADPERSLYKPAQLPADLFPGHPADAEEDFLPSQSVYQPNLRGRRFNRSADTFDRIWVRLLLVFVVGAPLLALLWIVVDLLML